MRIAAVIAWLASISCSSPDGEEPRRFMSMGTAGTGGIYYPLGGAIASRLSTADSIRRYTAEVTGGSVENVNRVAKGEIDLGFAMAVTVFEAYNGSRDFPKPLGALRIVAPLYPNRTHILVPDNSSVGSIGDLRGRRVSVGAPGSGTEQLARQVLAAHGITYADIDEQYLSFRESSDALRDGAIDAAILSVGFPASAVLEAVATAGARLLPIDSTHQRQLAERYPYYTPSVIPAGAYPGLDSAVPTVAVMNWIVATESLDGTVVTLLLDILRDEQERLVQVSRIAEQIDLSALRSAPIPLHPATAAWLEEQP